MGKSPDIEIINDPHPLRDKVTRKDVGQPDMRKVEDVVAKLSVEFEHRLPDELTALKVALDRFAQAPEDAVLRDDMFRRVHNLKGQAGTFGYMLISVVGNDWCRFIEHCERVTSPQLRVMGFFLDALNRIYDNKMKGDHPPGGQKLVDSLHAMVQKVLQA